MNKKSQIKLIIFSILFLCLFSIGIYAYSNSLSINSLPPSNSWSTADDLYVNVTANYDNVNNACPQRGNITSYAINVSYTWGFGNQSGEFFENGTNYIVPNGSKVQFNFSDIGEQGNFNYYFNSYNWSEGLYANCSNISYTSDTYSFKVDTTSPSITLDRPRANLNSTDGEIYFNTTVVDNNPNIRVRD